MRPTSSRRIVNLLATETERGSTNHPEGRARLNDYMAIRPGFCLTLRPGRGNSQVPRTLLPQIDRRFGNTIAMFPLNRFVDFLAMNRNFRRGFDAEPDLVAADVDDRNLDVVADENALIALA
jgi:hypothetical protein